MVKFIIGALTTAFVIIGCSTQNKPQTVVGIKGEKATTAATKKTDAAKKTSATAPTAASVLCKNGAEERKLSIATQNNGCQLSYIKSNGTNVIASAISGTEYCETVSKRVQSKLTEAGYTCQ